MRYRVILEGRVFLFAWRADARWAYRLARHVVPGAQVACFDRLRRKWLTW